MTGTRRGDKDRLTLTQEVANRMLRDHQRKLLRNTIEFAFELPPLPPGTEVLFGREAREQVDPKVRKKIAGMSEAERIEFLRRLRETKGKDLRDRLRKMEAEFDKLP